MNDQERSAVAALLTLTRYYSTRSGRDAELFEAFLSSSAGEVSDLEACGIAYRDLDIYFGLLQDAPMGLSALSDADLRDYGDKLLNESESETQN